MIRKGFKIKAKPIKHYASIKPEAACQPMQEYDVLSGEFYPERTGLAAVPLQLTPVIGYYDPDSGTNVPNAAQKLTNGHWYRFDNTSGSAFSAANEITSGAQYAIDSVDGSPTYGQIVIRENVLPANPVTYVFRATLVPDYGDPVQISVSYQCRTKSIEKIPQFSLDNATESLYNPWEDADIFQIGPVLKPAVAGASYLWESFHGSSWGALGSTHYDWAVEKSGDAVKVHRSMMQDQLRLRCTVTYTAGGKSHSQTISVSITRRLPKFDPDIVGLADIQVSDRSIAPKAVVRNAKGCIVDPAGEVTVRWYNASDTLIGEGLQPVIPISSLGSALDIGLDVRDAGGWKALETSDGKYLTDASGNLLIVR